MIVVIASEEVALFLKLLYYSWP